MICPYLISHSVPEPGAIYEPQEKAGLVSPTGYVIRSGGTVSMPPDKMNEELNSRRYLWKPPLIVNPVVQTYPRSGKTLTKA